MSWKIFHKYIQGNCSEEELRTLGAWLQEDPSNEDLFISLIEEWTEEENIYFVADAQAEWDKFRKQKLHSDSDHQSESRPTPFGIPDTIPGESYSSITRKRRRGLAYWTYSAAAVMLLIIALVFIVPQFTVESSAEQEKRIVYQEINTVKGQRTNLKLSDGSSVVLNANSTLRIPQNYGKENRTVYLEGEAFFKVDHDEESPFIVISHQTYTKDLGTAFNVKAYDSSQVEVAVEEGLVSLGKMDKGVPQKEIVELTPNKLGILKEIGGLTVSDIKDMDRYTGWTRGKLVFENTPLPDVLKRLEWWYDIDIEFKIEGDVSQLSDRTLTAVYDNMPMNEVFKVFSISMDVSYTREGRTFIFKKGNKLHKHEVVNTN